MEKFTRLFLLGEHSPWRFLRKIGLGLVLVLWTTLAFAESQVTYQIKVASWDSCYQTDNVYSVPVTMKDFLKMKKLDWVLNYSNTTDFAFIGLTKVNAGISTLTVQELTAGNLTFAWSSDTPVTILPDNTDNLLFNLNFRLKAFQHQYQNANQFVFSNVLTFKKWDMFNDAGQCDIQSDAVTNGVINVTEKWQSVVLDYAVAKCVGQLVTATVTTPENVSGMLYSFNGQTYTSSNKAEMTAPSINNQLVIKDATCISYIKKFDVSAVTPVEFTVTTPVYTICPGGLGDIEIKASKGTAPYTYYVIPEEQWLAGDLMQDKLTVSDVSKLPKYTYANYVVEMPAGTPEAPKYYWVAVQDANGCANVTGTNLLSWWKRVAVIDNKAPFVITPTENQDLLTTCYGQPDGRINYCIVGGTPFKTGYNISLNGVYVKRGLCYDSNIDVICNNAPCNKAVLRPGCYEFTISDSLGCTTTVKYCVTEPKKIVFNVDHTDAGCGQNVGELWISSVDASTGSGPVSSWSWYYTTDPTWATDVHGPFVVQPLTKVTNIPAGVYYVKVVDGNGCEQVWTNAAGDNAIKVLTTVFDIVYTPIKCSGDLTSVSINLISGDANHTFEYMVEKEVCVSDGEVTTCTWTVVGSGWQTSNKFTGISGDANYRYSVKDVTAQGCIVSWEQIIPNPPVLHAEILTFNTRIPSCPGNIDGNISVRAWGGTPFALNAYKFQIDNRPPTTGISTNDFAVGAGTHVIVVTDAAGCTTSVTVRIPDGDNFINFVDKIYVDCKGDSVNLFNAIAWTGGDGEWFHQIGLDRGYLLEYRWYPTINHTTDGDQGWVYEYWTSGGDWVHVPIQGTIEMRNPKLYISSTPWVTKKDIVTMGEVVGHYSTFKAGTYFLVAKDEWGCFSNVDTVKIIQPLPLSVNLQKTDASCFNTWTGEIKVTAHNGRFIIPDSNGARYQFVLVQQPDIFNVPNWYGAQVTWNKFQNNNNVLDDSTLTIAVQKGTYWLAIRDYCAIHDPSQIIILNEIVIGGKDAITGKVTVNKALCNGAKNGSIIVTNAAGGFDDFTYTLAWVSGVAWPSGTTWPFTNKTGIFNDLYAGVYTVTVKDSKGCDPFVKTVTVAQPDKLALNLKGVDVSCFGGQDGILRYTITGGTGPYKESTNNGANWYAIAEQTSVFDRRAGAGTYNVWIMDANGCTATSSITLLQPAKLGISSTTVTNVSCPVSQSLNCKFPNIVNDGTIKVCWTGGWNAANDVFMYTITATKGTDVRTLTADVNTSCVTFTGLTTGEWTISVYEWSATIPYAKPYIMDPDYATHYASGFVPTRPDAAPNPQQNPDVSVCLATVKATVGSPDPIKYTVEYWPVICKDTNTGEVHVHNVSGGTGPYWFMLEGPTGYADNDVWKPAGTGVLEYIFTGLPWGNYNVFIKDSKGCIVCNEAGIVNNVKDLTLMVSLVKNADCFDTQTGQIKLEATSFPTGYTLKYAIALASDVEQYLFPLDDQTFVNSLVWQDSNIFNVKSGVWIGYVKAINPDGRMCGTVLCYCIQGHSTDANGNRILNHRVFVDQPTQVTGHVWDKFSVAALCYGDANGKIKVSDVFGGSGTGYSAHVFGTAFDGTAVSKYYSNVTAGTLLDGLFASTEKKDTALMVASDYYTVVFIDSKGCLSPEYKVAVKQPVKFIIELVLKQDAFICPGDLAGVFEIRVVSGGTGTVVYAYEAWDGTTLKFSSPYGAINTFQGPAGLLYKGWAKDANGCVAYAEKFVAKPIIATFNVFDRTCFGDNAASAIVKMGTKDPARTYQVSYLKFDSSHPQTWSAWSTAFTDSIKLTGLSYGDQSTDFGHYKFQIKDNMGCLSDIKDITFEPVQTQLKTCCATVVPGECTGLLSITITGGITPYTVFIDGKAMTGASWTLASGPHTIHVVDAHLCISDMNVNVDATPISRTATAVAFVGEKVKFTDAEAKLDTMLAKGVTTVNYKFTNGCTRTLVITVTEQYRTATISEIQGTGDVSPLKDLPRQITGTVTAVVPGVGYYMQDARDTVNGRCGIFVADKITTVIENTGVQVGGIVKELNDVTTLEAQVVTFVAGTTYLPIVLVKQGFGNAGDAKNEKWESVLIREEGVRFQGAVNPDGSWMVKTTETSTILVDDYMYSYTPVDGHYYIVIGILNGANTLYKLEPRKAADVIDLTKTTPVIEVDNLQFKVYPNPFNDYLNIDNSDRLTRVTITNIAGQRVMDIQYPERVIRTSNLVSGVYVITLFTDEGIAKSERMVKR